MEEQLPHDLIKFIHDHISSVAQLEILLLLQTNPAQRWTVEALAGELRAQPAGTRPPLESLRRSGLLKIDEQAYFYAPATPDLHAYAVALAQAYLTKRVTIISLIFAKPPDSLRAFSDAFMLRKEPPSAPHG